MPNTSATIAQTAARYIIEEGLSYRAAKQRALKTLRLSPRTTLPNNQIVEDAVRSYINLFHAKTQPQELFTLRELALQWMQQLAAYQPLISGAVWNGTATRFSDIYLQLFTDNNKQLEIELINQNINYQTQQLAKTLLNKSADMLSLQVWCESFKQYIKINLIVSSAIERRGGLKTDTQGRKLNGTTEMLQQLISG